MVAAAKYPDQTAAEGSGRLHIAMLLLLVLVLLFLGVFG